MKKALILSLILFLTACAHPGGYMGQNVGDGSIKEATIKEIEVNPNCAFLGVVEGDYKLWQSFVPFWVAKQTSEATRDGAILKAQEMGGSHIVWREKGQLEYKMAIAEGRVYKCTDPKEGIVKTP
jgi:hypothetical protein